MRRDQWPSTYKIITLAAKKSCIVGGFNIFSQDDAQAVVRAAEEVNAPVLLMLNRQAVEVMDIEQWAEILRSYAKRSKVPVFVHLDHATDMKQIKSACKCGFDSVMYDGSQLSLEENIHRTKEVVRIAHAAGVIVEAEIGAVGYGDGTAKDYKAKKTDPEEAARFAKQTNVDWLAVSIGNIHRLAGETAKIDFELLGAIEKAIDIPLVLHGSTGISEEDMRELCNTNVAKVNIGTALRMAFGNALRMEIEENPNVFDRLTLFGGPLEAVKAEALRRMEILGLVKMQW